MGGSSALILQGLVRRPTEVIYLVDGVPEPIRQLGLRLELAQTRYRLHLAHFQSHYLPDGWEGRVQSRGDFARLRVFLVDGLDIFVGKLFSRREKDLDDLQFLKSAFSSQSLTRRLQDTGQRLAADGHLYEAAHHNWYVLFGSSLPLEKPQGS